MKIDWLCKCATTAWEILVNTRGAVDRTNRSIRGSIHLGMWTTSLDLTDAYFHIPIFPKFRKFLRFVWEDRVYAFKTMSFGLSTAPLTLAFLPVVEEQFLVADLLRYPEGFPEPFFIGTVSEWN
jgi:hypothetical protein